MTSIWLAMVIITIIIEIITIDLVSIWFAVGAFGALVMSMLGLGTTWQFTIFVVVSTVCLLVARPVAKRYFRTNTVHTNYDRVIGKHALVLATIDADTKGEVKVLSTTWAASSLSNETILEGEYCEVLAVEGAHLVVKKIEN